VLVQIHWIWSWRRSSHGVLVTWQKCSIGIHIVARALRSRLFVDFALLSAGKVALFTGHNSAGVKDVEEDKRGKHRKRVEDVLVGFVVWDCACET
jgi:hypothetical protein